MWDVVSYLENLLILLRLRLVDLLDSLNILLNVDDGMFPCLESLGEETGRLAKAHQVSFRCPGMTRTPILTLLGSVSGTASSLMTLAIVSWRDGAAEA